MSDDSTIDKLFPRLSGLLDPKAEREITSAIIRIYDYFNAKLAEQEKNFQGRLESSSQQNSQLIGDFASQVIGIVNQPNPLTTVGVGNGTVTAITFGNGLAGGTINGSGTGSLIIGNLDVVQKSNGIELVDSLITDDGTDMALNAPNLLTFGAGVIATVDGGNKLFILNISNLPTSDPGISGALWNNLGIINVSP